MEPKQPRKYILVGFLPAPNAKLHYQLGMKKQLTVAGDTGATPPKGRWHHPPARQQTLSVRRDICREIKTIALHLKVIP